MTAHIRCQEGRLQLGGVVHFDNAQTICEQGLARIRESGSLVVVDLHDLESGGSIDVAILLQWARGALSSGKQIRFDRVSDKLKAIIRVSGLTDVLPLVN